METPHWYKWVILLITSISTFFAFGYITTTTSIGTIYYIDRYNERIISNLIGPVQIGLMHMSSLPSLYLSRKIGNRIQHLIGAVLLPAGLALTSFATGSWQGLLLTAVCAGIGGAMMQVATTQVIKLYFPGRQVAPFGAICLTMNAAAMAFPQVWRSLMENFGWEITFYSLGGITSINILCGLMYFEPSEAESRVVEAEQRIPKLSLVITRKSSSMYLADLHVSEEGNADVNGDKTSVHSANDISRTVNEVDLKLEEGEEKSNKRKQSKEEDHGMLSTLRRPQTVAMMMMTFFYSGGITACLTVAGDYAEIKLGMSPDAVALSLTIMGAAQIFAALIYMFLTFCTEFSATLLHSLCMFIMSACALGLCFATSSTVFTVLLAAIGFSKAITSGNSVPLALELIGSERMMQLYVIKSLLDGIGSSSVPFLAVYMQENFDSSAALYLGASALFVSGCMFVPFYNKYLHKPTIKSKTEFVSKDVITTTNYAIF